MRPFRIIDWRKDFIAELAGTLVESGDIPNSLVVFPHLRPRRYLLRNLAANSSIPKPFMPPEILSVGELFEKLYFRLADSPGTAVQPLERAGLLYEVVRASVPAGGPLQNLPVDREKFFPWGLKLADLMEELFRHARPPAALEYMEDEVLPPAAALLGSLDSIFHAYVEALEARDWTTPGLMAGLVARKSEEAAEILGQRRVILAGFYALTGTEKKLFKALCRSSDARVLVHADPETGSGKGHWSCRYINDWAREFGARIEADSEASERRAAETVFHEAFDLHSQLKRLEGELSGSGGGLKAVVLPDTGSLMPVLHHLPQGSDVNVSMGYPLSRSPLYRLMDQTIRLQETSPEPGIYYWRDVLELIRHPYLKTLSAPDGRSMRVILGSWENRIRTGDKYVKVGDWRPEAADLPEEYDATAAADAIQNLIQSTMTGFEKVETLSDLAEAIVGLCSLLIPADDAPENLWQRFPVDGECLFRLLRHIVPQLSGSSFSREAYGRSVLFTILRRMLEQERVPFEAEPLTGLQVLGLLETRLLKFDEIHVIEATDDKLPGASEYDPLLPDPLRGLLGLPDGRQRDYVTAYNFYRLAAGADRIRIYYRAGEEGPSPLAGRSIRSRFAEQLVWQEEQKAVRLISPGDGGPVRTVSLEPGPLPESDPKIAKDDFMRESMKKLITQRPISPSLLDSYLKCQLKFYLERVARLKEIEEVSEEVDHAELGSLVHEVLKRFFGKYLGERITPCELDAESLVREYLEQLEKSEFFIRMPLDQRLAVRRAGRLRLENYLENCTRPTTILGLEREYSTIIETDTGSYRLAGRLDRVDRRDDGDHVLDYKTGSLPKIKSGYLHDELLLERLRRWSPGDGPETAVALAEAAESIQLPVYLYVYSRSSGADPQNAAWVELRDKGDEKTLFGKKTGAEERARAIRSATPEIISFIIRHMLTAGHIHAMPGGHCSWCPFRRGCPAEKS